MPKDEKRPAETGDRHDQSARNFMRSHSDLPEGHPEFERQVQKLAEGRRGHAARLAEKCRNHE